MLLWSKKPLTINNARLKQNKKNPKPSTTQFPNYVLIYLDLKGHPTPN